MSFWSPICEVLNPYEAVTRDNSNSATTSVRKEDIKKAERCLIDNGIDPDEACTVLQAIGYILLDVELYPEPI